MVKTKFGNATLIKQGYYLISSCKEGNHGKLLHRLIYEDYYKVTILDWVVVHHIDENKLNNNISNLKLMTKNEHRRLHTKGEKHPWLGRKHSAESIEKMRQSKLGKKASEETRKKLSELRKGENNPMYGKTFSKESLEKMSKEISKTNNSSGYYRVTKHKKQSYKQGFRWVYQYTDDNKKKKQITSKDIRKLKEKVLAKGLEWCLLDKDRAIDNGILCD